MPSELYHKAPWLVRRIPAGGSMEQVKGLLIDLKLHTVCQSASCPNIGECFGSGTATFLILGGICTRNCRFCGVPKGSPSLLNPDEPENVAKAVEILGLRHTVITSVTRDDLPDGGASHFVATLHLIRQRTPAVTVEVLIPDFRGNHGAIQMVLDAAPDVFNHNIETVPRLYPSVRPEADYWRSLEVLATAALGGAGVIKSGLMVGLGETEDELKAVFLDLTAAGANALTIGQYLRPSKNHLPVVEYIHPARFKEYEQLAYDAGFIKVESGPLVRSSYHAERVFASSP